MPLETLVKQPAESRLYAMEFSPLLEEGETLSTAVCTASPVGLTLSGAAVISGTLVHQRVAGGTSGVKYKLTFTVTTSGGNTLESDGILQVRAL